MKKRIHSIGGTLTIKSIKDEGVSITAVFRLDSDLTNY
jgi:signal transduction histidine kinase